MLSVVLLHCVCQMRCLLADEKWAKGSVILLQTYFKSFARLRIEIGKEIEFISKLFKLQDAGITNNNDLKNALQMWRYVEITALQWTKCHKERTCTLPISLIKRVLFWIFVSQYWFKMGNPDKCETTGWRTIIEGPTWCWGRKMGRQCVIPSKNVPIYKCRVADAQSARGGSQTYTCTQTMRLTLVILRTSLQKSCWKG